MFGYGQQQARGLTREQHIAQLMTLNPTAQARNQQRTIFEVGLRLATGVVLTLRTTLPPGFPAQAPQLQINSPAMHPWLDAYARVTGCAELNAWNA